MAVDQDFDEEDEEDEMEVDLRPKRGNIVISEEELHGWPARRIAIRSFGQLDVDVEYQSAFHESPGRSAKRDEKKIRFPLIYKAAFYLLSLFHSLFTCLPNFGTST